MICKSTSLLSFLSGFRYSFQGTCKLFSISSLALPFFLFLVFFLYQKLPTSCEKFPRWVVYSGVARQTQARIKHVPWMSEDGFCNAALKLYLSAYYSLYDKLDSTVNSYSRISTWSVDSVCSTEEIKGKTSKDCSTSHDYCYRMAEGLVEKVDLILVKLSKLDKLNILATSLLLYSALKFPWANMRKKFPFSIKKPAKTIKKSVDELKGSLYFVTTIFQIWRRTLKTSKKIVLRTPTSCTNRFCI